jgi:glycosyltransferase involved in cell wall biosynthesis
MQKPRISVIIPTKNEEKYIGKTLKQFSKLKEKFILEVIVSDGRSTDKTVNIARKYADKVLIASKGNKQSIALGRNAGARAAYGEILFHTDADVIIPQPEKFFPAVLKVFEEPGVVGVTCSLRIYPKEEIIRDRVMHWLINGCIRLTMPFGAFLSKGECQIVRRKSFESVGGYNEDMVVGEDCNLFLKLSRIGRIKYLKNFKVYHSPRRFRKTGYIRLLTIYFREGFSLLFFKKNYLKKWEVQR